MAVRGGGSRRVAVAVATLFIALSSVRLAGPPPAAAAGDSVAKASTTYTVNPAAGRVDVAIDYVLTNNRESSINFKTCYYYVYDYLTGRTIQVPYDCTTFTTYLITTFFVAIEHEATALKVTADSGSASASLSKSGTTFDEYKISITGLEGGFTRKLRITYQLPGGSPRSDSHIRLNTAVASFCAITNGPDGGSLKVVVPNSYAATVDAHGGKMSATTADGSVTYDSGQVTDTYNFWACINAENETGYDKTSVTSAGGRQVDVMAWPGDGEWKQQVSKEVASDLSALEQLIGRPLPGSGAIAIHEVSDDALGSYAGSFDAKTGVAWIGETIESGVVAHELSHGWFNASLFSANWLREGSAEWARSNVTKVACIAPGPYPVDGGTPSIADWRFAGPTATQTQQAIVGWQYRAACAVVVGVADKAGNAGMQKALIALIDGASAYQSTAVTLPKRTGNADFRNWLDAVDELALVPAGVTDLDFAQKLVVQYGGQTVNSTTLAERSGARAAYHSLIAAAGDWAMPLAVLAPLDNWQFARASDVLTSGAKAVDAAKKADTLVPSAKVLAGGLKTQFQDAKDLDGMKAVEAAATGVQASAEALAPVLARVTGARPVVEGLGLTPNSFTSEVDAANTALAGADADASKTATEALAKRLDDETAAAQLVTDAKAGIDAQRDPLRLIGLLFEDFGPRVSTAMTAVGAADLPAAQSATAAINQTLTDAPTNGIIRIVVVLVVVLLALAVVLLRRRRARARLALATAAAGAGAGTDGAGGAMAAVQDATTAADAIATADAIAATATAAPGVSDAGVPGLSDAGAPGISATAAPGASDAGVPEETRPA